VVLLQPLTPKVEAAVVGVRLALMVQPTLELRVVRLRVGGLAQWPEQQEQALLAAAVVLRQQEPPAARAAMAALSSNGL
jgi:hypothetical protein